MRVICVSSGVNQETANGKYAPPMPNIPETTICTVIDESEYKGLKFYLFAEYYNLKYRWWYDARCFIPLSDKDETKRKICYNNQSIKNHH